MDVAVPNGSFILSGFMHAIPTRMSLCCLRRQVAPWGIAVELPCPEGSSVGQATSRYPGSPRLLVIAAESRDLRVSQLSLGD